MHMFISPHIALKSGTDHGGGVIPTCKHTNATILVHLNAIGRAMLQTFLFLFFFTKKKTWHLKASFSLWIARQPVE